ncbi:hypothetical protein [Actinomycetospora flava]|uniref:FtsK domain-containing protein n=1 Tax=Actinomycetospora flava TaxID=3129232 RepID=A0ABU8LZK1_9PSEU
MALFAPHRRRLRGARSGAYRREVDLIADRHRWTATWRHAAEGAGITRTVRVAAGQTVIVPPLVSVSAGAPLVLIVRLLPGQLPADVRAVADRLAPALGATCLRIAALSDGVHVRLELLDADPLDTPFVLPPPHELPDGFLGIDEGGADLGIPWPRRTHAVVQGSTGSGKSWWLYGALSAHAGDPLVTVAGIDPSGLLWRPWTGLDGAELRVSGLAGDLTEHVAALEALCSRMDERLAVLPDDRDQLDPTTDLPLVVVVLEELPGFYAAADLVDRKLGQRVRGLVGRLLAEGRKVAYRVVIVCQRADAAIVGGAVRAQAQLRLSFRVEPDGFRMLHPVDVVDPDEHEWAPSGVAVLSAPGLGTLRLRAGALPYDQYVARVRRAAA